MSLAIAPIAKAVRKALSWRGAENDIAALSFANLNPLSGAYGPLVDKAGRFINSQSGKTVIEDFLATGTNEQAITISAGTAAGGARVVTTNVLNHLYSPGSNIYALFNIVQQDLAPSIVAAGLDIACDQTASDGMEICSNAYGATGRPFIVGRDPAFYAQFKITPADVSGLTVLACGFRKLQAAAVAVTSYVDYATIGLVAGAVTVKSSTSGSSNSTDITTDTTDTLADATAVNFRINVSAAGVVTYQHDSVAPNVLAAPTVTAAYTFPDGTALIPFILFIQASDLCDTLVIGKWEAGYQ